MDQNDGGPDIIQDLSDFFQNAGSNIVKALACLHYCKVSVRNNAEEIQSLTQHIGMLSRSKDKRFQRSAFVKLQDNRRHFNSLGPGPYNATYKCFPITHLYASGKYQGLIIRTTAKRRITAWIDIRVKSAIKTGIPLSHRMW